MFTKQGWLIIFIVLIIATGDFFIVLNEIVNVGCIFIIVQNILLPVFMAPLLMDNIKFFVGQAKQLEWMIIGALIGSIPTAAMLIATEIHYFYLGGKEKLDLLKSFNTPTTSEVISADVSLVVFLWFFLTLLSAFSGLFASNWFSRRPKS